MTEISEVFARFGIPPQGMGLEDEAPSFGIPRLKSPLTRDSRSPIPPSGIIDSSTSGKYASQHKGLTSSAVFL
jgi:hypothetical protein